MREKLVVELVKEVLGPREGPYEVLHSSPLNEYLTGVLAPVVVEDATDIESSAELPAEDTSYYEGETADVDVGIPPPQHPALDPKKRPSTFGLSFTIEASGIPAASVCLTWARYLLCRTEEGLVAWRREPRRTLLSVNLDSCSVFWIDGLGRQVTKEQAEISFHIVVRPVEDCIRIVDMYFVNRIKPPCGKDPNAEHYVFQPQIRVVLEGGARLVPCVRRRISSPDERKLDFIYRKRPVMARGHLCSAVWRDIDPESVWDGKLEFPECRKEPPFGWPDAALLSDEEKRRFSPPDVRTEFVPIYSIPFPQLDWPEDYGKSPELNSAVLAEIWNPEELRNALSPICEGYARWIGKLREELSRIPENDRDIAKDLLAECETSLERMRRGLEILCSNEEARLAFCFSNKAINVQWKWRHRTDFIWRPFQLAFILLNVESIVNPGSKDREACDLLWVPTGAGKTEAYLALIAFVLAFRRRRVLIRDRGDRTGAGVTVITRYTLRLLTIQQFRRTLSLIAACEYLRVFNLMQHNQRVGWRPARCSKTENYLWGTTPFSLGLWVGGGLSPNRLSDMWGGNMKLPGALSILKGEEGEGDPAQVLECPACGAILSVPEMGLQPGPHTLHLIINCDDEEKLAAAASGLANIKFNHAVIRGARISRQSSPRYFTLILEVETAAPLTSRAVDELWQDLRAHLEKNSVKVKLMPVRASRPGYFIRYYTVRGGEKEYDFDIYCPNPECPLRVPWIGGAPSGSVHGRKPGMTPSPEGLDVPLFVDGNRVIEVQEPFIFSHKTHSTRYVSDRIPIPALTVDEQIYRRLPSIIVATVDKFARPPFEPLAAALFGNVDHHHCVYGYYRPDCAACQVDSSGHPVPAGRGRIRNYVKLPSKLEPPELIIQDELHLIDGSLGSLVGLYETAVDFLCEEGGIKPKYVASTATIRRADEQVSSVFLRKLSVFPPHGLDADDRFFIRESETHALQEGPPGRLYVGICALGRGPLTPLIRIYARLLQTVWCLRENPDVDYFWTLTGYFNAIRELAGARALYRQDIPQRVDQIAGGDPRPLEEEKGVELSSRTPSTDLPALIDILSRRYPDAPDALFTTSMFGTGVDIQRIGLMVVNGQPKTTSAYIQSTGRVGRSRGALVVTFFRATRPRDLSHYEFFIGYHRQLHRFVEPPTVYPFSSGALERALGPVMVFILRNMRNTSIEWQRDDSAILMQTHGTSANEVLQLPEIVKRRAENQPPYRRPATDIASFSRSELDRWRIVASRNRNLKYVEYAITVQPRFPVVLGDYQHLHVGLDVVYENAPNSLRDVEETAGFET